MSIKTFLQKMQYSSKKILPFVELIVFMFLAIVFSHIIIHFTKNLVNVVMDGDNGDACEMNLVWIYDAFRDYDEYWGCLPPVWSSSKNAPETKLHSWRVLLLPFLGEKELYDKIRLDEPWDSPWNSKFHSKCPAIYQCPGLERKARKNGETSYFLFYGSEGLFRGNYSLSFACLSREAIKRRDPSHTLTLNDTDGSCFLMEQTKTVNWMDPKGDLLLSDAIFTTKSSSQQILASEYFAPHHYDANEGQGIYGWCNALATEGRAFIDAPPPVAYGKIYSSYPTKS